MSDALGIRYNFCLLFRLASTKMHNTRSKNLVFEEIVSDRSPEFYQLYEIYKQAFPIEDEREPPEAFGEILAMNSDRHLQQLYGPYREVVAAVRLWKGGPIIGGVIFGVTTSADHIAADVPSSVQAIYTFFAPECRGLVPMRVITDFCRKTALETFGGQGVEGMREPIILFEVNNPLKMTEQEIEEDIKHSGVNPFRRYGFWMRAVHSNPLDFPYVQPPLRDDGETQAVRCLDLFCTQELPEGIPSKLLLRHLCSFVALSVLKGRQPANQNAEFREMEEWLNRREIVEFLTKQKFKEIMK